MLAGDADAGQHSKAMLDGRRGACARRGGGGSAPPLPRADDVAPRRLGPACAANLLAARGLRPRARRKRREVLRGVLAAAAVPRVGALRGSVAGPASVVEGWGRGRGGAAGVELAHGGHQAVAGEPAAAAGELPRVPAEPARGNGVVSES